MAIPAELWPAVEHVLAVVGCFLVLESLGFIRRTFFKQYYVPIYFVAFPLDQLNKDLGTYLADQFGPDEVYLEDLDEAKAKKLRRRIIVSAFFSMLIAGALLPMITGAFSALLLDKQGVWELVLVVVAYKLIGIARTTIDFGDHAIASVRNRLYLATIYVVFLGLVGYCIVTGYNWSLPYVSVGDWYGLGSALADLLFGDILLKAGLVAVASAFLLAKFSDPDLRAENLRQATLREEEDQQVQAQLRADFHGASVEGGSSKIDQ